MLETTHIFTDEVKQELVKRYWSEIVPKILSENQFLSDEYEFKQYHKLLPYFRHHVLGKAIEYCEKKSGNFDPIRGKGISYFETLAKNLVILERKGIIDTIKYSHLPQSFTRPPHESSLLYYNSVIKKLNRQYQLDKLV